MKKNIINFKPLFPFWPIATLINLGRSYDVLKISFQHLEILQHPTLFVTILKGKKILFDSLKFTRARIF